MDENWIQLLKKNILLENIENDEGYIIFLFSSATCVKFLDKSEALKDLFCRKEFARNVGVKGHRAYIQ